MKTLELKLKKDVLIVQPEETGNMNYWVTLYSKYWDFKCLGSELTEEIASELVEVDYSNFQSDDENYELKKNYVKGTFEFMSFEESFISAVESKGFYWLENPNSKTYFNPEEYIESEFLEFKEAEEKTFRNPLIFVKK